MTEVHESFTLPPAIYRLAESVCTHLDNLAWGETTSNRVLPSAASYHDSVTQIKYTVVRILDATLYALPQGHLENVPGFPLTLSKLPGDFAPTQHRFDALPFYAETKEAQEGILGIRIMVTEDFNSPKFRVCIYQLGILSLGEKLGIDNYLHRMLLKLWYGVDPNNIFIAQFHPFTSPTSHVKSSTGGLDLSITNFGNEKLVPNLSSIHALEVT